MTFGWQGTGDRALEFPAGDGVAAAGPGRARLRFNSATAAMQASVNGGAYADIGGVGGGGWTDDGAIVRLTTVGDTIAIGAAAMVGAEKLRLVGNARVEGSALVIVPDDTSEVFTIREGGATDYFSISTSNGSESISIGTGVTRPAINITAGNLYVEVSDNIANAISWYDSLGGQLLDVNTTNGSEAWDFGNLTATPDFTFNGAIISPPLGAGAGSDSSSFLQRCRSSAGLHEWTTFADGEVGIDTSHRYILDPGGNSIFELRSDATGTVRSVGFFGGSGAAQSARPGQVADNSTGSSTGAVAAVTGTGADAALNDIHATMLARINAIELKVKEVGLFN